MGATMNLVDPRRCSVRVLAVLLVGVASLAVPDAALASAPEPPDTTPVATNDFLPSDRVDDCVGLLQRPNCGSSSRGGWRQGAVFGALGLGLGVIGWRVWRAARR